MRLIFIGVFVLLALIVLIMPLFKKKKPSLFAVVILLLPAVGLGYLEYSWMQNQEKLQEVYRQATEIPIAKVECQRMASEWADAYVTEKTVNSGVKTKVIFKHSACAPLFEYMNLDNKDDQEIRTAFVDSMMVFSEEVVKLRSPELPEERSRCTAFKAIPEMVQHFGGTYIQGMYVQEYYKKVMKNKKITLQEC